jgi:hypothetical protein
MDTLIKHELHELIDQCDSEWLLEDARALLQCDKRDTKDWWDDLTEEDQNLVLESERQYGEGNFISHEELMKEFRTKKK